MIDKLTREVFTARTDQCTEQTAGGQQPAPLLRWSGEEMTLELRSEQQEQTSVNKDMVNRQRGEKPRTNSSKRY